MREKDDATYTRRKILGGVGVGLVATSVPTALAQSPAEQGAYAPRREPLVDPPNDTRSHLFPRQTNPGQPWPAR